MPRKKKEIEKSSTFQSSKPLSRPKERNILAFTTEEHQQCHIHDRAHDKVNKPEISFIRERICKNGGSIEKDTNTGKHYCQFHLQTNDKPIGEFETLFKAKLDLIKQKISEEEDSLESRVSSSDLAESIDAAMSDSYQSQSDSGFEARLETIRQERTTYDFRYVWFPSEIELPSNISAAADFRFATFGGEVHFESVRFAAEVDFESATFNSRADFRGSLFCSSVNFQSAIFNFDANFHGSIFLSDATFQLATFAANTDYGTATFCSRCSFRSIRLLESGQLFFRYTAMKGEVDFALAIIQGYLHFEAGDVMFFDGAWLDQTQTVPKKTRRHTGVFEKGLTLTDIRAENPDRISFNKARLCPSWFVNADPRKFIFTDVLWENHLSGQSDIGKELDSLRNRSYDKSHNLRLLTITFRNLATNAEEFNRFDDASNFRKAAFECEKKEKAHKVGPHRLSFDNWSKGDFAIVHRIYRSLSFYGESWSWAALVLVCALIFFGVIYNSPFANFEFPQNLKGSDILKYETYKMNNFEGFIYSLYVATLQRPDPKPADSLTRFFVIVETIFAPLQAALLALAIRRKFMR